MPCPIIELHIFPSSSHLNLYFSLPTSVLHQIVFLLPLLSINPLIILILPPPQFPSSQMPLQHSKHSNASQAQQAAQLLITGKNQQLSLDDNVGMKVARIDKDCLEERDSKIRTEEKYRKGRSGNSPSATNLLARATAAHAHAHLFAGFLRWRGSQ